MKKFFITRFNSNSFTNQEGQTLIVMIFVMLIALSIGIASAYRFIGSLRRNLVADNASRAQGVAEAAIEKILALPEATLEGYAQSGNCGSDCTLIIPGADGVNAVANVTLTNSGGSADAYPVSISVDGVSEVDLTGYPDNTDLQLCWNNPEGQYPSIRAYLIYGDLDDLDLDAYAVNTVGSPYSTNGFDRTAAGNGLSNCFTIIGRPNPQLLRFNSYYNDVDAYLFPTNSALIPVQGILITAQGVVEDSSKTVSALKIKPFLPIDFDYILLQKSTTKPLSN